MLGSPTSHFYIVSLVAFLSTLLAVAVLWAARGLPDPRTFFLGMGFIAMATIFLAHGLGTSPLFHQHIAPGDPAASFSAYAVGGGGAATLAFVACSSTPAATPTAKPVEQVRSSVTSLTPASELRTQMNRLLDEHVYLAMAATDTALDGRGDEYKGAVSALDANSAQLGGLISSAYGDAAGKAFLDGWRRHIGFFVDYTQGVAGKDQPKRAKAVADLNQYAKDLADLLNSANGLPKDAVIGLVQSHAIALCTVIDAQGSGDSASQYAKSRIAADQVRQIGDPLTEATVLKFPDKFSSPPQVSAKP